MLTHRHQPIITIPDRQRLGTLIDRAAEVGLVERRHLSELEAELEQAVAVDPHDVPDDVITMNSTARLRDLDTGELLEYTVVYPRDANPEQHCVSVLAPIG